MKRWIALASTAAVLAVAVAGCGGGGGSSVPAGTFTPVNDFTLQPNLKTLPNDGSVTISNVTPNSVTLSGAVPALSAGSVILSSATLPDGTYGLLRKVVSVAQSGGNTIVQTADADISSVFQTANIHQKTDFPAEAFANAKPGMPGITFGPTRKAAIRSASRDLRDLVTLPIQFNHVYVQAPDGTLLAEVNGEIDITVGFETELQLDTVGLGSLKVPKGVLSMIAAPYVNVDCPGLTVTTKAKGTYSRRFSISDPDNPISYTLPLGPLSITAKLGLFAQVDGALDGTGTVTVQGSKQVQAGVGIGAAVGKGENQFGFYFNNPDPQVDLSTQGIFPHSHITLNATLLQGEVSIGVSGLGSAFARLDAVRGNIDFDYQPFNGRNSFMIKLDGEVKATVGANLKILFISLYNGEFTPLDYTWNIHYWAVPDTGQSTAPPSGPSGPGGSGGIGIILH